MMSDGKFLWYYHVGIDEPDLWSGGEPTRESAIAAARDENGDIESFSIVEADIAVPGFNVFDAETIIEQWEEANAECFPGHDPDPITATAEQKYDLTRALGEAFQAWLKRHDIVPVANGFGTMRNRESFKPAADDHLTIITCGDSCDHVFDGPDVPIENGASRSCSKCGKLAIDNYIEVGK